MTSTATTGSLPPVGPQRVAFYSHDTVGLGHTRRNLALAGAIVAAWPAPALVISYELLMVIIRGPAVPEIRHAVADLAVPEIGNGLADLTAPGEVQDVPEVQPAPEPVPDGVAALNGHAADAARIFAAEVAAGQSPSIRRIRSALHVGQDRAISLQAYLTTLPTADTAD